MNTPLFGTAGLSNSYHEIYKNAKNAPEYTAGMGLTAFEYQFGRGVRLSKDSAEALKTGGEKYNVAFSAHAPYYISMSSMEEAKRLNSLRYVRESAAAVRALGGRRVIFHSGSAGKQSREEAMVKATDTMRRIISMLDEEGFDEIIPCPETMGKMSQLGSLEEVLQLCAVDKRITPCIDFGHLNARTLGGIKTKQDFADILDKMADSLQDGRAANFHVHFSKIEYTAGGEKRHLTFQDTVFGPDYQPFIELCYERKLTPVIICESDGTQAEDARTMAQYYASLAR